MGKDTNSQTTARLIELADGCNNGASNLKGLLSALSGIVNDSELFPFSDHPTMPVILGHMNYLVGQGTGPDFSKLEAYNEWKDRCAKAKEALDARG